MKKTDFSTTLQELRKEKKITQEQLANYLGVSPQAVSKWENGSYPEGDLLPRIADYFNVSIDYLYKRGVKSSSLEQEVMDELRKIVIEETERNKDYGVRPEFWETLFRILWAGQLSPWGNNKEYFERRLSEADVRAASVIMDNSGYAFMNLYKEKEFYFLSKTPENGYAASLKNADNVRNLFKLLSEEETMKTLIYLATFGYGEYVSCESISIATGVETGRVRDVLETLSVGFNGINNGHHPVTKVAIVNNKNEKEVVYSMDMNVVGLLIGLFQIGDCYIDTVDGYHMQIVNRSKSWIDKGEL